VKIIEPPILLRVEVALKDNKSGQGHVESYPEIPEIDSGLRRADQYFWFTPSSRWDEDYTVTVTSRGVAFVARIDRAELAIAIHLRFEEPFPDRSSLRIIVRSTPFCASTAATSIPMNPPPIAAARFTFAAVSRRSVMSAFRCRKAFWLERCRRFLQQTRNRGNAITAVWTPSAGDSV
jgi:hypothetical protein